MPGDLVLRNDIQLLADAGILSSPVTTWPIPWATVWRDLQGNADLAAQPPKVLAAAQRVRARMNRARTASGLQPNAEISVRTDDFWLRTFEDTPREEAEVRAGVSWMGERFAARLQASFVPDPLLGDNNWRADGSYAAAVLGNHILSIGATDRWWGPAWDNSLVFSSNARPIPAITLERRVGKAFETKWLSWLGPWNYTFFFGQTESDRTIPDARLTAFRVAFRPLEDLEVGLFRTAMWCGEGRPCGFDTFWDIVLGRDNVGEGGIGEENEPGDQMGGFDARWVSPIGDRPYALYTQWVGEDEKNKLPSLWFFQAGLELWGAGPRAWRAHFEWSSTLGEFWEDLPAYDVAYNHPLYQTGHRYRGRAVGAGADGDSEIWSAGLMLIGDDGSSWNALVRWARINEAGDGTGPDLFHSVAIEETERVGVQLTHRRSLALGGLDLGYLTLGGGVENRNNQISGEDTTDLQAFVQWTWDLSGI